MNLDLDSVREADKLEEYSPDERNKNFLFGKHIHDLKKSFTKNSKNSKGRGGKKKESTVLVKSKLVERENPSMESQYLEDIKVKDLNKQI